MKAEYRKIATQEQIEAHFRLHGGQWSGGLRIILIEGTPVFNPDSKVQPGAGLDGLVYFLSHEPGGTSERLAVCPLDSSGLPVAWDTLTTRPVPKFKALLDGLKSRCSAFFGWLAVFFKTDKRALLKARALSKLTGTISRHARCTTSQPARRRSPDDLPAVSAGLHLLGPNECR